MGSDHLVEEIARRARLRAGLAAIRQRRARRRARQLALIEQGTRGWQPVESTADFFERRWLRNWSNGEAAARDAVADLQKRGATFFRFSVRPAAGLIIVEGWIEQPIEQGELPL